MSAELRAAYPRAEVRLIESRGGVFEVSVDDRLIFSKKRTGRHAEPGEVLRLIANTAADQ